MDVNNHDLSLSLYNYLCKVVGSEDVVRTRRRIFNAFDYVSRTNDLTYISGGSKAEGLDLSESDYDILIVQNLYPVYENIEDLRNHKQSRHGKIPLIMDTIDTKPGYTRLKLYDRNDKYDSFFGRFCYDVGHKTFVSSSQFRDFYKSKKCVTHGPSNSDQYGYLDTVQTFHCKKWTLQAQEWIHRSRLSWPRNRLMEIIVQCGVFFVPIGCKNSPRKDFEFRISFNVAEKILVHSFSYVQLLCYVLLKTILNHYIKPHYGDLLCSYFLKTIMFWVSEESVESAWQPHNLLGCFDQCFKRLVLSIAYSTCLHYFIPQLDLFLDRFSKSEHDSLTSTLQSLYKSGWQCLLHTKLFSSFNFVIYQSPASIVPYESALPSVSFTSFIYWCIGKTASLMRILIRSVFGSLRLPGKQMYALVLSQVSAIRLLINEAFHMSNKQQYRNYRKYLNHLLLGLHHDAVSGWLLLASFFYMRKQYQQCLHVLKYCLQQCTPDKILLDLEIDTKLQHEFNIEMQQHVKNGFHRTCKGRVVDFVVFDKLSFILPAELSAVVVDEIDFILFPPVVFAHFLHCICLHRLNRNRDKINALLDLETTVREMYFISREYMGISCQCIYIARKLLAE